MIKKLIIAVLISSNFLAAENPEQDRYVFFFHNRFLEDHALNDLHPSYGKVEYLEILHEFKSKGFIVISEKRAGNVNARQYALAIVSQIDSLLHLGVSASNITVIGTSKGGYIAQYVSTFAANPNLNFVFIACFTARDLERIPEINFCGNILTIFEASDPYGVSALARIENSTCAVEHFKEIELHTGYKHGFLFRPLEEWITPCVMWANKNYELSH
jgi:hypothetical protein